MSINMAYSLNCEKWYYKSMFYFVLLFLEIAALFLLSRKIGKVFSKFLSINLLSFLFLPGVIIHELSHMLIAVILFVPVGDMEFTPKKNENELKLGSIEIAKTDPIRRSLIGFAPVFVGLMLIIGIVYLFTNNTLFFKDKDFYILGAALLAIMYLLFVVSNTMFSSSRDMEGTIETIVTLLVIGLLLYFLGLRVPLSWVLDFLEDNSEIVKRSALFLSVPIVIDIVILGMIRLLAKK